MTDPRTNYEKRLIDTSQTNYAGFRPCAFESCERWISGPEPNCSPEHKQRAPGVFVDARTMAAVNLDDALQGRREAIRECAADVRGYLGGSRRHKDAHRALRPRLGTDDGTS